MITIQRPSIWTLSYEAIGPNFLSGPSSSATGTFPATNDALFVPIVLDRPALVTRMFTCNGNSAGNNVDVGIYTADGARIVSKGSTAQSGTTTLQFFDITDTYLSPGRYFMAVAADGTSATFRRFNPTIIRMQQFGILKATSAFPLPTSVTFTTPTAQYIPSMGLELGRSGAIL
jgi:hypothetical protein